MPLFTAASANASSACRSRTRSSTGSPSRYLVYATSGMTFNRATAAATIASLWTLIGAGDVANPG